MKDAGWLRRADDQTFFGQLRDEADKPYGDEPLVEHVVAHGVEG